MLEALSAEDEELSDDVKEKMFIFDNLMQLDDRGFQRLVRDVAQENLLTALKGVDEVLAERFLTTCRSALLKFFVRTWRHLGLLSWRMSKQPKKRSLRQPRSLLMRESS